MNKFIVGTFDDLKGKKTARDKIKSAEENFTAVVGAVAKSLRGDLLEHLTTRPSPAFLDALRLYADFDLAPSRVEIEALMEQNGSCVLGLRALNRVLERTKSTWRVDASDAAAYESDLTALEKLAHGNIRYAPDGLFHELAEVYNGEQRLLMRDDGSLYSLGFKWDRTSLLTASGLFESTVKSFDGMAKRWSGNLPPTLRHIDAYEDRPDPETGEIVTARQQLARDVEATARAPEIERSERPEVEAAHQRGRELAAASSRAGLKRFST